MIQRRHLKIVQDLLTDHAAVAILGPRQVGKTTLAMEIADATEGTQYLDLESPADRARLAEPELYLSERAGQLVILDEVQRMPRLFSVRRGPCVPRPPAGDRPGPVLPRFGQVMLGAGREDYPEILAVLLPAEWIYLSWARTHKDAAPERFYLAEWIALHTLPEFEAFVNWLREETDRHGPKLGHGHDRPGDPTRLDSH